MKFTTRTATVILALIVPSAALAGDGQSEINQTCAVQTGCFAGDTAGFPVTITTPGSYRLTGSLDLQTAPPSSAISITAPSVHLDLGGFEIVGPATCTGAGPTLSCAQTGGGSGVEFYPEAVASSVRNGTVRGMGVNGVSGNPRGLRVSDLTVIHNGNDGIVGVLNTLITDCVVIENGSDGVDTDRGSIVRNVIAIGNGNNGIEVDGPGGVIEGSTSQDNGGHGIFMSAPSTFQASRSLNNELEDSCGGGICTEKKRYYQSSAIFGATPALTACDAGFKVADFHDLDSRFCGYDYDPRPTAAIVPNTGTCSWTLAPSGSGTVVDSRRLSGSPFWECDLIPPTALDILRCGSEDVRALSAGAVVWGSLTDCASTNLRVWCVEE